MRLKSFFAAMAPHSRRERTVFISSAVVAALALLFDQCTKLWVERAFKLHESRPLIDGWLAFTSARNKGAAWSMLDGHGWLLLIIAGAAFCAIVYFFHYLTEHYPERYFSLFLVLSGILGNSIDRLWRGFVIDFIHVHYYDKWDYPIFNIADIAICTGVGIFVLSNFLRPGKSGKSPSRGDVPKEEDAAPSPSALKNEDR